MTITRTHGTAASQDPAPNPSNQATTPGKYFGSQCAIIAVALVAHFGLGLTTRSLIVSLLLAVPLMAVMMFIKTGRGNIPVPVAWAPTVVAASLGVFMLANPVTATTPDALRGNPPVANNGNPGKEGMIDQEAESTPFVEPTEVTPPNGTPEQRLNASDLLRGVPQVSSTVAASCVSIISYVNTMMHDAVRDNRDPRYADATVEDPASQLYPTGVLNGQMARIQAGGTCKEGSGEVRHCICAVELPNHGYIAETLLLRFSYRSTVNGVGHWTVAIIPQP